MVILTQDINLELSSFFKDNLFSSVLVLADFHTADLCLPLISGSIPSHFLVNIQPGEEYKNLQTCEQIWNEMTRAGLDRKALVINLGGGVIGDMGGFCASVYKRGISFINIPTTLLAQVDASIGGKLGIDFHGLKNHIGLFRQPDKVFIDTVFLKTLPERELKSGFAEVVKHSLIADSSQWDLIKKNNFKNLDWPAVVNHSVQIKSGIVDQDPREQGIRKILNFGHTVGHAIETFFLERKNEKLLHGEAVAAGMVCETFLSEEISGLDPGSANEIRSFLINLYGKCRFDKSEIQAILTLMEHDKKNERKNLRFSLLKKTGEACFDVPVRPEQVAVSIRRYRSL